MRWNRIKQGMTEGAKEAQFMQLQYESNWTPILIYMHVTRTIIGAIIGIAIGICVGLLF